MVAHFRRSCKDALNEALVLLDGYSDGGHDGGDTSENSGNLCCIELHIPSLNIPCLEGMNTAAETTLALKANFN